VARGQSSRQPLGRLEIGEILGAHGVRGEVRLRSFAERPSDIKGYSPLLGPEGQGTFTILAVRQMGTRHGLLIATLAGIGSRESAQALAGAKLYVARDRLKSGLRGEYLHADLVGCEVFSRDGRPIGVIVAVQNFGAGDLVEIRRGSRTEYLPFNESFVPAVDIEGRRLVAAVDPFE
jgi:16S rRNA processing protein RimM